MFIAKVPSGQSSSESDIHSRNKYKAGSSDVFAQFVTGYVSDVVTSKDHTLYKEIASELFINAIKAVKHVGGPPKSSKILEQAQAEVYIPLMRGIQDVPTRGDQVLVCTFGGINYYLGPINTINSPNFNPDLELDLDQSDVKSGNREAVGINPAMIWNKGIKRLEKRSNKIDLEGIANKEVKETPADFGVGDMVLEGRQGNSIRLGQRSTNPYIVISNKRIGSGDFESWYDDSFISITSGNTLTDWYYTDLTERKDFVDNTSFENFNLASNKDTKNNRPLEWEDTAVGQILMSSGKITFNSRFDNLTLSSGKNINMGSADNLKIYTKNSTIIESKNIYLGEEAVKNTSGKSGGEPIVLGDELRKLLMKIVKTLMTLKTTANTPAMSGPPDPGTITSLTDFYNQLANPAATPFLSNLHYIEKNKTKK